MQSSKALLISASEEELLASLPMYDLPEVQAANDALWEALSQGLQVRGVYQTSKHLTRTLPLHEQWGSSRLLFSQTCGFPWVTHYRNTLRIVATPCYDAPGCEGAFHRSFLVVRAHSAAQSLQDLQGARAAINSFDSNTGMGLLCNHLITQGFAERFFQTFLESGSHLQSVQWVASGKADVAAIDCVTYALLRRYRPELTQGTRVLDQTALSPALPFVTSHTTPSLVIDALMQSLREVINDPLLHCAREALLLRDINLVPEHEYTRILTYAEQVRVTLGFYATA